MEGLLTAAFWAVVIILIVAFWDFIISQAWILLVVVGAIWVLKYLWNYLIR